MTCTQLKLCMTCYQCCSARESETKMTSARLPGLSDAAELLRRDTCSMLWDYVQQDRDG
jgi:hypothetical protein